MTRNEPLHRLGLAQRLAIRTLVPRDLRAAFEGDLIEERALRASGALWIWLQLARSAPSLLVQQLRLTRARARAALPMSFVTLATGVVFLALEDVHRVAPLAGATFLGGIGVALSGLFFVTSGMRLVTLFLGVCVAVVASALAAGVFQSESFVLFWLPTLAYPGIDAADRCDARRSAATRED